MFNLEKYLDHEQRDPFANSRVSSRSTFILVTMSPLVSSDI